MSAPDRLNFSFSNQLSKNDFDLADALILRNRPFEKNGRGEIVPKLYQRPFETTLCFRVSSFSQILRVSPTSVASRHLLPDEESGWRVKSGTDLKLVPSNPRLFAGRRWREATEVGATCDMLK